MNLDVVPFRLTKKLAQAQGQRASGFPFINKSHAVGIFYTHPSPDKIGPPAKIFFVDIFVFV